MAILSYAGLALQLPLIYLLFLRGRKDFPLFLCYIILRTAAGLALILRSFEAMPGGRELYWGLDIALHGILLAVILRLIHRCASGPQIAIRAGSILAVVAFVAISLVLTYNAHLLRWLTGFSRNLSFCEELLNLILWSVLVRSRHIPMRVLLVSAGLGIQVTGEVIGQSFLLFAGKSMNWAPNLLVAICDVIALAVWIYAFTRAANTPMYGGPAPTSPAITGARA